MKFVVFSLVAVQLMTTVSGLTTAAPTTVVPSNGLRIRPPADETVSILSTIVPSAEASVMATEEFSESSSSPSASPSNPPEDLPSVKEVYLRQFVNSLIMLAFLAGVILTYFGLRELYWWSQTVTVSRFLQCNRRQEARAREAAAARREATRWENYQEKVWRQVLAEQEAVMESQQAATTRSTRSQ